MGVFVSQFYGKQSKVPNDKKEEFAYRMEKLFQVGGMMQFQTISLYNIKIHAISKVQLDESGMDFRYNYFEDEFWEDVSFGRKNGCLWSGKVGTKTFAYVMIAAYVLQELYEDGLAVTFLDGHPVCTWKYVGWINYLFGESYHVKNFDQWKLFEFIHEHEDLEEKYIDWNTFGVTRYAFIGGCEIYAVLNGVDKALEKYKDFDKKELEKYAFYNIEGLVAALDRYKTNSDLDMKEQMNSLLTKMLLLYQLDYGKNLKNYFDECDYEWIKYLEECDAPALCVKKISEMYACDFWSLWNNVKQLITRRATKLYSNNPYYVAPVSTTEMLKVSEDDRIPFREPDGDIQFTKELYEWFDEIKDQIDKIVLSEQDKTLSLKYIMSLIQKMEDKYRVYVFANFLEETIENLQDAKYIKLWLMCEKLLNDNNKTQDQMDIRRSLRRYMALVANKPLRERVFSF